MARVALLAGGDLERLRRRLELVEHHDAALRLRDRLLGDHEHVAVLERDGAGDQRREVVALAHLGQPEHGYHAEAVVHFKPFSRSPTCAL